MQRQNIAKYFAIMFWREASLRVLILATISTLEIPPTSEKTGLSITSSFYLILDLSCTGFIYCFRWELADLTNL